LRERENASERAVSIAAGRQIERDDLPEAISRTMREARSHSRHVRAAQEGRTIKLEIEVPSSMDEIERRAIEATLDYTSGDKTRAARALGIGRKTLYRKLQSYGSDEQ
jgi:DNA-binding NtrC family response regulator